ncbi:retrovirus-related Pol polyprotein from transposon TNT 1-94 [Trichonephila clavipes]|uniref:Retrovirus-related Pol polyprotein from transposon TNT 1-94 n=1 Tax=Trichonephila clavipes TaxID=2585209 RepID=A0A8X6W9B4_TRICX|nr:retrovirus-related Pol polyprotein from transposon TNT 1-94 [Trichonephila clavipes]
MFSVQKSKIKCHYCGKFGHFRREYRNGTAASSGTSNRRSRTYRKGPELRQHPSVSSPIGSSVTSDEFNYNSFRGGRRDRNYSFKDRNELSRYHGSANSVVHQNQGKSKLSFFLAEANLSCNVSKDAWIVDTAASNHFTNNRDLFINFVNVVNENMMLAINGVEFPIEGKGDVKIWFNDHECLLKNVFFSSKLRKNLMSGPMLDLYGLKFIDVEPKYASSIEKSVKIKGKPNDLRIWHERFGHANVDYILKTSRLNAVRGLPKIKRPFNFECEPCRLNKYKRVSFQSIECTRSKAPLNLLHCDVWGPANVIGKRGEKYYLSVLDDYSRRMFIFPMCHKSDTYDILAKFIIRAERQLDLKVKAVRTDFGGEFIASILSDFFVERGIKHEKTNIYTPQQNGASERLNRTVIDGARTVLSESGLDKSFWPEAVLYFVHTSKTSFGSTLYVGTPRPLRGKLDPKAKKGILVGFALGTRGYRVWIPEDSKVIETSNVRFQKPQQSNGGAVLASPNLKFSDYKVFENGDDDTDEDEGVHNIPISLPQDSDSKTEGENLSRTENSTVPVKTTWKRVVIPRADGSRNDIYFYEVGKSQRLRSCNEIKKYCKDRNLKFDENIFSFKGKDTFEGIVNPQPSVSGVQSVKVKNNA